MKKSILIFTSLLFNGCLVMAQTTSVKTITAAGDTIIAYTTANITTTQVIYPYKTPVVTPPIVVQPPITITDDLAPFDYVIYAYGSLGWNNSTTAGKPLTTVAKNGTTVGQLTTKKGNWLMQYNGTWSPIMDGKVPALIDNNFVAFKNIPATWYQTTGSVAPIGTPREMWLVSRYMPGQRYEERLAGGGNSGLLGDNSSGVRMINAQYGFVPNSVIPSIYITHIERMVIKDQTQADYWLDGKYVGTIQFQAPDLNNYTKTENDIGVVSNNAVWDFAAQYTKVGTFSDTDAATIYNLLAAKYNVGVLPNQILLSNISSVKGKTTYTPSATVINTPAGVTVADPSKWNYQWYYDDGSLQVQKPFSTVYQPAISLVPTGMVVKVLIEPKDTNGNVWRYLEGTYQ